MRRLVKYGLILLLFSLALISLSLASAAAEGGQVQGVVWLDRSLDGLYDSGEISVEDVKITLEKKSDAARPPVAGNATSSRTGEFHFDGLEAGEYRLGVQLPKGYSFTYHGKDSVALPASGRFTYSLYFTVSDGQTTVCNIGTVRTESGVSFTAFEDTNLNGGRMSTEPLIRGVRVELVYTYQGQEYVVASATTDKQGEAVIPSLTPGTYYARAALPEHLVIGPLGEKVSSFYNCFHPTEDFAGYSDPFTLEPRKTASLGIGLVRTGSLTGSVWFDENNNGLRDGEEAGLSAAVVSLRSDALNLTRQASVNENGEYLFEGLQPGSYRLEFELPEGMIFTYPGDSLLSDIASKGSVGVAIQEDVTTPVAPVGAMKAVSQALSIFEDVNLNGAWDEGEPGLPGAVITASQGGKTVDTVTTDLDGGARFAALRGGEALISVSLPEGFLLTKDESNLFPFVGAQREGETALTLVSGEEKLLTAAATQAAAIRGFLFEDPVNTGLYQEGYGLLSGFTVQAIDGEGVVAAAAQTMDGAYTLYPLLPGDYTVRFLLNDPYVASPFAADQAPSGSRVVNQTPAFGETGVISLTPGETANEINGGVFRAGTVDGMVTLTGGNGGVKGVKVTLLQNGEPVSDFSYGITDDSGAFLIKGVLPGAYTLRYEVPENAAFTQPMTDEDTVGSEAFTTESGSQIHMPALSAVYTSVLSGDVSSDTEGQVILTLTSLSDGQERQIAVDAEGSAYRFAKLRPGAYTVKAELPEGTVFGYAPGGLFSMVASGEAQKDITFELGDNLLGANIIAAQPVTLTGRVYYDENRSASPDEGESGAESRTVNLRAFDLSFTQTTDTEGRFAFAQLPPGEYALSLPLEDNEILVGVAAPASGEWTVQAKASAGSAYDLPLLQYASVEGHIWNLDGSDKNVSGISVALLNESGAALAAAETDESGAFSFTGLMPGDYALSAQLPEGYLFARSQDTQKRESFIQSQPDGSFASLPFAVTMGDERTGMDIGMGAMGQLGDRAWLDENGNGLQDLGERDMPGILIELYQHGELAASAVTDEYGRYLISNLYPGEYEMRVTMHKELKPTRQDDSFPLLNSILPESDDTTVTVPSSVVVPSGSHNLHCDLGFVLRKTGVYPAAMDQIPVKDWRPYNER